MALQDQTLANTQAKMGLEVARRRRQRNADAAMASISPGAPRQPEELPWWAQGALPAPGAAQGSSGSPGAPLGAPRPGMAGVKEGLSGLGGLILGVAGRKAAAKARKGEESLQARELRDDAAQAYEYLKTQGVMPDEELLSTLKVWQSEGLPGVERLVQQGFAPVAILGILGQQESQDRPDGGWNGAPAGGGLPELGV